MRTNKGGSPTALETPDCPPHHYLIDCFGIGRCSKCPEVKDFRQLQLKQKKSLTSAEKAALGGRKKRSINVKEEMP